MATRLQQGWLQTPSYCALRRGVDESIDLSGIELLISNAAAEAPDVTQQLLRHRDRHSPHEPFSNMILSLLEVARSERRREGVDVDTGESDSIRHERIQLQIQSIRSSTPRRKAQ
jgi:hypothetical protein